MHKTFVHTTKNQTIQQIGFSISNVLFSSVLCRIVINKMLQTTGLVSVFPAGFKNFVADFQSVTKKFGPKFVYLKILP